MVTNINVNEPVNQHRGQNKGLVGGLILIIIGLSTLLSQFGWIQLGLYLVGLLGVIFILGAFLRRKSGLLVPGGILLGVNAASILMGYHPSGLYGSGAFLLVFAGGWLLISALSVVLNRIDPSCRMMLWPLIPGGLIGLVGGLMMMGETGLYLLTQLSLVWPVVLILLGLWVIFRRR